jgi:hypothetical protein
VIDEAAFDDIHVLPEAIGKAGLRLGIRPPLHRAILEALGGDAGKAFGHQLGRIVGARGAPSRLGAGDNVGDP